MPKITPNLWFDGNAMEAAEFYCSVFPNSKIKTVTHYTDAGPGKAGDVLTVEWELDGTTFVGINGGSQFKFDEAVSFEIDVKDQDELDYYWDTLTANGGEESQCGWLRDKFGLSWQVVPEGWAEIYADPDKEKVNRVMQAMFKMKKLDIAALKAAEKG